MKTYDKEGFKGLTHPQLVKMRIEAVEEMKKQLKIETDRENSLVEYMGWEVFDQGFFTALEMVKNGKISITREEREPFEGILYYYCNIFLPDLDRIRTQASFKLDWSWMMQ